jgi:hypothetical protein
MVQKYEEFSETENFSKRKGRKAIQNRILLSVFAMQM